MLHKMFSLCPYVTVQESVDLSGTLSTPKFWHLHVKDIACSTQLLMMKLAPPNYSSTAMV